MNPVKYLCKDLSNKQVPLNVWLQGNLRTDNEVITLSDSTGEVKITGCDIKDLSDGDYCCVIGVAVKTNECPEIAAAKFIKINPIHKHSWELEVKEAQLILQGQAAPQL